MGRSLRIEYEGALYHVTSRGDRKEDIYEDDVDRELFLSIFSDVCDRYHWRCHSYCLMSNHYHLLIETIDGNLSKGMRQLNGVYSQTYNRRHSLVGHVFQGRFTAILVEKEAHLLELSRYIVLNPVRARMVACAQQWRWSSYRAVVSKAPKPNWLEIDWTLLLFDSVRSKAIRAFELFVAQGMGLPSPFENLKNQIILGSDEFIATSLARLDAPEHLEEVPKLQKLTLAKPIEWYRDNVSDRDNAIVGAYQTGRYSMKEIGECFGLGYSMISRIIKNSRRDTPQ